MLSLNGTTLLKKNSSCYQEPRIVSACKYDWNEGKYWCHVNGFHKGIWQVNHKVGTLIRHWFIVLVFFHPSCLFWGRRAIVLPGQMDETCCWCKYARILHIYTLYTLSCISSDLQILINPCHVHSDWMFVKTASLNVCRIKYAKLEDVFLCLWLPKQVRYKHFVKKKSKPKR